MRAEVLAVNAIVSKDVVAVNLATGVASRPLPLPITPDGILVSPTGRQAYAFSISRSEVVPVNLATWHAETPVRLPGYVYDAVLSPDGRWLYVTMNSHIFVVIDTKTQRVVTKLYVPGGVGAIVVNGDGTTAYVDAANLTVQKPDGDFETGGDDITAVDLVTRTISHVFVLPDPAGLLGVSNNFETLYAAGYPDSGGSAEVFYRVNLVHYTLGAGKPLSHVWQDFISTPSGQTAYVETDDTHLAPLDLATLSVGSPIAVGEVPSQAVFSSRGRYMAVGTIAGIVVVDLSDAHTYPAVPVPYVGPLARFVHGAVGLALVPGT
jgi:DNA-binding beta-propeller fold protein YncE